jgi:hypothetical protein
MKRLLCGASLALLLAGLSACVAITPVPAGPVALGGSHQVILGRQWSDISAIMPQRQKNVRVLSIDGPLLNRLYLAQGLAPGEGLMKAVSKEHPSPSFHADMSPTEMVEFVSDSVASLGYQRVTTSKLRPAKMGSTNALRFDLTAQTESGLQLRGAAETAVLNGKLYLVLYLAPAEHYFDASSAEVESIMNSAT